MAFGTPYNEFQIDSGEINGDRRDISCLSWFPHGNDPYPISFKFKGDDDAIISVKDIKVLTTEDKRYCGIPSKEYKCRAVIGGLFHDFKLIFYLETCKWEMVL